MVIRGDFPGGNIVVDSISEGRVELHSDMRDTAGQWFYWCMDVEFDAPGEWSFHFNNESAVIGARGPAYSADGGVSWRWLGFNGCTDREFTYHASGPEKVRFCTGMQYLERDLEKFLAECPDVKRSVLCLSNGGREVELLTLRKGNPRFKVLLTSRHHCCEMMATHVLEGFFRAALADPEFPALAGLYAVPFVDKDGVESGDQGKNRLPHDHARDYGDAPIYAETKAVMEWIGREEPAAVFDLHCPWLKFDGNEVIHFVGPELKRMEIAMDDWAGKLERELAGSGIAFSSGDSVRFGQSWNTAANYTQGRTLARWAADCGFVKAALSLEIPYANAGACTLDAENTRRLGGALERVVREYLKAL